MQEDFLLWFHVKSRLTFTIYKKGKEKERVGIDIFYCLSREALCDYGNGMVKVKVSENPEGLLLHSQINNNLFPISVMLSYCVCARVLGRREREKKSKSEE